MGEFKEGEGEVVSVVPWATTAQHLWLTSCCVCGQEYDTYKCSGCPRVFHLECLHAFNCMVYRKKEIDEEQPRFFCQYCCEKLEKGKTQQQQKSSEQIEGLINEILRKCKQFPSAHPASILGETLEVILKRRKRFPALGFEYGGVVNCGRCAPSLLTDLNCLVQDDNFEQISLEEGKVELGKRKNREQCSALVHLAHQTPDLPTICRKLQDILPIPNGRSYLNMLIRDGICTPPNAKISKNLSLDLRNYIQSRFNKHINNINQRHLKKQLIEGGFKELRLNYYMRYEMALDEIKHIHKFAEIVGKEAPWMRLVNQLLGENCELMEVICQITRPGAPPQSADSDEQCSHLNMGDELMPPYAVTVFIPLVDLVAGQAGWNGAFEFHVGSHNNNNNNNNNNQYDKNNNNEYGGEDFKSQKVVMALQMGQGALVDFRLRYRCLENCSNQETYVVSLIYVKKGFNLAVESENQSSKPSLPKQEQVITIKSNAGQGVKKLSQFTGQHNAVLQEKKAQRPAIEIQINMQPEEFYKLIPGQPGLNLQKGVISEQKTRKVVVTQGCQLTDMENYHFNTFLDNNQQITQISKPVENSKLKDLINGKGGITVAGRNLRATNSRKANASEQIQKLQANK
eukprot:TRINITY_DN2870_c0_g1_i11.p1 TRINITY_DN2870_c0_g1~~TRINITY_DN2870_c0_g1_i11.p1  ORF type:complete len:627 (-),score=80.83 TRINITY_DN2870_c0_g1_i11:1488-3368(-)